VQDGELMEGTAVDEQAEHPLMTAIVRGLPITLLVDLIDPNGPRSWETFEREGASDDAAHARRTEPRTA
jgi:hypothetical protein